MNKLEKSLVAFEKLMNQLSDEKLDSLISKIDKKGIKGPSVDEYFGKITQSIASFYEGLPSSSTASVSQYTKISSQEAHIGKNGFYHFPFDAFSPSALMDDSLIASSYAPHKAKQLEAGENSYAQAA